MPGFYKMPCRKALLLAPGPLQYSQGFASSEVEGQKKLEAEPARPEFSGYLSDLGISISPCPPTRTVGLQEGEQSQITLLCPFRLNQLHGFPGK